MRASRSGHRDRNELMFFELEWAEVPDEQAEALLADDRLAFAVTTSIGRALPAAPA